ncbi:hypothetical protein CBR_g36625 [Chara braunii]|uniref:Uncharacterized protein n=1 Tax=Chara braunii TaxID=69332 RepID=A0A388LKZ1_CHABU|nr:hypothetical protein CBR_g36625 [Chara braunii]|eukprot:GBG83006.1 hypothetical protein CBR_g36625 [Chara braunii]
MRLAGSIVQWVDDGEFNFKFTLKKHYKSDGSVDGIAKGCKVAGRMFRRYGHRAMSLPHFLPLAPGHDEAVHVTDFLEVWAKFGTSVNAMDVGPGTSISGPVGFAGGECSEREMGGQGGLPATPPGQEVGMSDDSEDDHLRAPLKPGLHVSRRHGLLGESTPHGGGDGERLQQGSESTTPRGLVKRIGSFVRGMQVAEVSPGDRAGGPQVRDVRGSDETTRRARPAPGELQTELSQEREASGNVAGEEEVSEQGLFGERSAEKTYSHPEKNWYYLVCGQHNVRAVMMVKDHPVFDYYNFCKWAFRPIYFDDDEFDGYAHVSCEDNMKDKKNPPRLLVLSIWDIHNIWKIKGKPRVVLSNASKKQDEVRKWMRFMALAMKKTPYTPIWNLSTEAKKRKEWAEKLRYYLPLAMADDSVFALGLKFYEEWSKGKILASDGRRWTEKLPTHEEVAKPGLSTVTDSQGLKKHVWYVKVDDPSLKKGKGKPKKGAEEKTFYIQVPEPDVHCWKELVDLTDREKERLLNGVLNLNVVSKKQLFEEFKDRGLNDKLWNESKKFFTDTTYVNKCPQFLGCQHDNNIKRTAALVNDQHFPAEWKRVVLSVITGDRAKGKKSPRGVDECINIMWTRTSALTTLAQFNVDPLTAIDHKLALGKLGHQLRSHACVLDLCGTVDRAQWDSGAFASLSELLGFVCQDYWTLVVFVPCLWNLSFMTCLSALGATRCYTGKWVRKTASKKTHQFGNSVWEEPDVIHILFKGEDPRLLTHPMYEGAVAEDDAAALRRKQKVTLTDVEEKFFKSLTFADIGNLTQRGALYKDGERNPNQLCNQLLFFCGVADAVLFFGKPHTQVVWSLLQQGRHVLAVDGDTTELEYTVQYVTHEVSSKAYPCDFHHVVVEPVYDPNKDMFFKLTPKKRHQVYSFLYSEQPRLRFDPQYVVRKEVVIEVLQGYHGASRAGAVSFIKRLEYVIFNEDVVDPADFTLDKYKLAFGEEDDFNIETEQEESVEDDLFDLDGELTIFNAQISESPSVCKPGTPLATPTSGGPTPVSSPAPVKRGGLSRLRSSLGEPIRFTPQPERLRPGHPVPPDHPHLKAPATPFHMGDKHTFSTAEDWGHDIVWHPDHFQPVLLDGEWAVAVRDVSGGWIYDDRWDLETFKSHAYEAVLERLSEVNRRNKDDPALREYGDTLFEFLQSNKWLEVSSAFYALPSSPSIKQVSWELPGVTPPAGVVKRKSRGKDGDRDGEGGGQRGTGGGSEHRSTEQRSPRHAGGGEGKKGSREKKNPRSEEKTKHHRGDGQGADGDPDKEGGVLAVTGSTSMETGNDLRSGCITRPGEQDPVISSTSETQFVDAVGGAGVAKHGTCFAQLQKRLADCLGSIRTSETTSLSGTQCLPGSETTTYHGSDNDKLEPCSVSPQKEFRINPNREGRAIEGAQLSKELERVVRVSENPGDGIRIHPNQEAVSAMTDDRCQDAVMLCVEAHKELQADCRTEGE